VRASLGLELGDFTMLLSMILKFGDCNDIMFSFHLNILAPSILF